MTEKQATDNGYRFSGIYTPDYLIAKNRAREKRIDGFLACVVMKEYRGRANCSTRGYSVYIKNKGKS